MTRAVLRQLSKALAQDGGPGSTSIGVQLLLTDPGDYNTAIATALAQFGQDRPNRRVVDYPVATAGFKFPLSGASSILPRDPDAPDLPTCTLAGAGAGNVDNGAHLWAATGVYDIGETELGQPSAALTVADKTTNGKVSVVVQDPTVTVGLQGFNIYRTVAGGSVFKLASFVAWVTGAPTTTTYVDNVADASLGIAAPTVSQALDPDSWLQGASSIDTLWFPYSDTVQGDEPNDPNTYRTRLIPGGITILEFMGDRPAVAQVIRLEFTKPHVIDEDESDRSTILAGDKDALVTISAAMILQVAANKAAQNTGNTGLPNDVVDRRTQSDVMRSRSKELMALYATLVGRGGSDNLKAASGFKDLDVEPSYRFGGLGGFMWHPNRGR